MKEIKKSASFTSKQRGKDVKFNIDLNYSPEYDSFIIKVKEGEGFMSYTSSIERMPLKVIQKLNNMLEEVIIQADSKYHTTKFDYDYADIGQFSLPDSEWNKTQEEYTQLGKKIVKSKFDGDLTKAYDYVVRKKREFGGDFQSGVYADGGYFDGTIPKVSTYMTNFAKGGSLDAHGIHIGDTFLKTLSGTIQKVRDKNGKIVYINLANGERSSTIPLPFDDGGEVKYFVNKDGIRVRSKVEPKNKLSEREWMAKHNESKEARSYAFGGLFGKSPMMSKPKKINLNDKQVRLNSGEYVQVLDQDGDTLMVMELSKIGTGASPKMVKIDDVDMTSFAGGGETYSEKASQLKGGLDYYSIDIDLFNGDEIRDLTFKSLDEAKKEYLNYSNSMVYDGDDIMDIQLIAVYKNGDYENINLNKGGGVGLIGNQKRIDMNHNGRIDAEDFKLLRSSMNGAWRNERKHVNKGEDYEVRYARPRPKRTGYKGKRNFKDGGGISNFERLSRVVAKNYEGKRVKPKYQKEYGKVYSKSEAKEVGNKVAGKVKAMQKAESGASVKKGGQGGIMVLAKKIRKEGESWKDALKRAGQQLK
jgi:hypothetical protein